MGKYHRAHPVPIIHFLGNQTFWSACVFALEDFSTYISVEKKNAPGNLDENQNKKKQIHHETNSIKKPRNKKIPAIFLPDSANSSKR